MRSRLLPCLLVALAACHDASRSPSTSAPAPAAEFILAAGDSAYWVTSDTTGIHVRGAPIELARVDGRFVEVYVVDDDHSFQAADLIGQSVYRRDLRTGDSVHVFTDSIVPALARAFAASHPQERRLAPNEEGDDEPELRATATLEFTDVHGPFASYALHTDVERAGAPLWHTSRHGVLDLRTGKAARLSDIVGPGAQTIAHHRDDMLRAVSDSMRSLVARLPSSHVDATSFTITTLAGAPAIAFAIPTAGTGELDHALTLPAVPFDEPSWWRDIATSLPVSSTDGSLDSWRHGAFSVLARYDSSGNGHLVLANAASKEWPIALISSPANRIYWLDRPSFDPETRHALARAFDAAAAYGSEAHIAAARAPRSVGQLTSYTKR